MTTELTIDQRHLAHPLAVARRARRHGTVQFRDESCQGVLSADDSLELELDGEDQEVSVAGTSEVLRGHDAVTEACRAAPSSGRGMEN